MTEVIANENPGLMDASAGACYEALMVSGFGQYHTDRDREIHGRFYPGKPYSGITLAEIFEMAKNPPSVPKAEAQWVIFSSLPSRVHAEQRERGNFYALWADFDQVHCTLAELHSTAVKATGSRCLVYASRSATEDHHKARLIVPLAEPCDGQTFVLLQKILNDQLHDYGLIPDRATERAGQVCYLPNRGEYYDWHLNADDDLLNWRDDLGDAVAHERQRLLEQEALHEAKIEQARQKARQRMATGQASPIDAFNEAYPVELLFEQYGYRQTTPGRWLSPNSESGSPGVTVKGKRWLSAHESDAHIGQQTANGAAGDAFDLFVAYEHQGDRNAALRAAGELFTTPEGVSLTKQNQRSYMQAKAAALPEVQIDLSSQSKGEAPYPWPEPQEIQDDLPAAPTFEANVLLPEVLADFVLDEADRMSAAPDFVAAPLIVALGATIGARCALKPKRRDDWIVTPNLFGGVVGAPSSKKSPTAGTVMRFLDRLEAKEAEILEERLRLFQAEMAAYEANESAIKAQMKKAASGAKVDGEKMHALTHDLASMDKPEPPLARRFKTNDSTVEKLADLLSSNHYGLLVFRDELMGLLSSWEKEGREGDRAFYLEGWNGTGSYVSDRIGRGTQVIKTHCLSVFGGIQPDLLQRYLSSIVHGFDNDGRIQRFQVLVYPELPTWKWTDRYPVKGAREAVRDIFDRLADFDPLQDGAQPADDFVKLPAFSFSEAAQEIFIAWSTELNTVRIPQEQNPLMQEALAKYEKLFCSIALILHLASGQSGDVGEDSALRAAAWCEYLEAHARRIYGLIETAKTGAARTLSRRIQEGKLPSGFTARDVVRKGWGAFKSTADVETALDILEGHQWVVAYEDAPDTGRPTTRYAINPKVRVKS